MQVGPSRTLTKQDDFDDEELLCRDVVCVKEEKIINKKFFTLGRIMVILTVEEQLRR